MSLKASSVQARVKISGTHNVECRSPGDPPLVDQVVCSEDLITVENVPNAPSNAEARLASDAQPAAVIIGRTPGPVPYIVTYSPPVVELIHFFYQNSYRYRVKVNSGENVGIRG